jgi:uncharacterized protein YajQ (UPF0234 family)
MPSFDIVSEVNMHEVTNAVDQANREIANRYDFKDSGAFVEKHDGELTLHAPSEFHLEQMMNILSQKLTKRGVDIDCLELGEPQASGKKVKQSINIRRGIDTELAKKMVKMIKTTKLKVQSSIQGDKLRVTGKKRDDLQQVIALFRQSEFELPLQFENFRD